VDEKHFGRKFNEIVIDQEPQVVPIILIELNGSNFQSLSEHFERDMADETTLIPQDENPLPNDDPFSNEISRVLPMQFDNEEDPSGMNDFYRLEMLNQAET